MKFPLICIPFRRIVARVEILVKKFITTSQRSCSLIRRPRSRYVRHILKLLAQASQRFRMHPHACYDVEPLAIVRSS